MKQNEQQVTLKIRLEAFTPILLHKNLAHLNTFIVGKFLSLPTKKKKITVLRSPHIDKKSREQFELCTYSGYLIVNNIKDESIFLNTLAKNIFSGVRCTVKKNFFIII